MLHKEVVIIGGGISGLTAAYQLNNNSNEFILLESADKTGGVIETIHEKKYTFENGPNTFLLNDKRIYNIFKKLNLKIQDASPNSKNRYVLKNKKCIKVPISYLSFLFSSLFSLKTKCKIMFEIINLKKSKKNDESVSEFIIRRLNKEVLDYSINPFVAGTYAGDPDLLSIKHAFPLLYNLEKNYGSLIMGLFKTKKSKYHIKRRSISFNDGLNKLIESLTCIAGSNIELNAKVTNIIKKENKFYIDYKQNNELKTISTNNVICTVPTYSLKNIFLNEKINSTFDKLSKIYYPPIISVTLGYKDIINQFDGFGLLIPKKEKMNILGVLYISSLFNKRAPEDETLITIFLGGSRQPNIIDLDHNQLLKIIYNDLKIIYGLEKKPIYVSKKIWKNSIPQYNIGYQKYLDLIKLFEKNNSGFYFTGNFKNGIALQSNMLNALDVVNNLKIKN